MIDWLSDWAEAIIIAVIIATIIEMILPEGSSKKYIKVVIGVYILFTIISPIVTKFTGKSLAVSDIINLDEYINVIDEKQSTQDLLEENNYASIRDIYIGNLKADIQTKLQTKGYHVTKIYLDVSHDENYTLNEINLTIDKEEPKEESDTNIQVVNEIDISISNTQVNEIAESDTKSKLSSKEQKEIKEYLSSVYEISEKNIIIN